MDDENAGPDEEHRRDLLEGSVAPAVARARALIDGGLVGWARRRAAASPADAEPPHP